MDLAVVIVWGAPGGSSVSYRAVEGVGVGMGSVMVVVRPDVGVRTVIVDLVVVVVGGDACMRIMGVDLVVVVVGSLTSRNGVGNRP